MRDQVLIANGQGFWGDSILGPVRLVREGPLDYLTLDYLAEVTLSIMQKLRARDPKAGYATDFVKLIGRILPDIVEKEIKVIANAGGGRDNRRQTNRTRGLDAPVWQESSLLHIAGTRR